MTRSVGVVLPAYRPDLDRLSRYVHRIDEELDPAVIHVELDAPREGVVEALSELPASVHAVPNRRGKGAAITAGFETLSTDVLAFVDADGSTPVDSVEDVVDPVVDERAVLSVGSRRHPDATIASHQTLARRRMGDAFAWLARRTLEPSLYDYQCGAKALDRDVWQSVREHLYEPGFAWDIELVAVIGALDHPIVEVPIVWEDAPGSTVSPVGTALRLARGLLVSRHRGKVIRQAGLHRLLDSAGSPRPNLVDRLQPDVSDET
jgi:glycosyltransferase involved in cell wall biosynthesis